MDILTRGQQTAQLALDVVRLLETAVAQITNRQQLLQALLDYADDPNGGGVIAGIVNQLGVDGARVRTFITSNRSRLALLLGKVSDLGDAEFAWDVETGQQAANAGVVAVNVAADASAKVSADDDGDLFDDGTVTYDTANEVFLRYEVEGTVSGGANVPSIPITSGITGKAAFGANASLLVGNYFRHAAGDDALSALVRDVRSFALPYHPEALLPGQFVRVHATGSVFVSGEISWGKTIVATGEVTAQSLNVAATEIGAEVKLSASAGFTAETSGDFNIVVSRDGAMARVQLVKVRTTRHGTTLKAGAGITITGIDKVVKPVLAQITTPLNELLKIVQGNLTKYGDLNKLFSEEVGQGLDALLDRAPIIEQIQDWLGVIQADVNLREKLEEILTEAVDDAAGDLVDDLQGNLDQVTGAVKTLIARYQAALAKVNKAVAAAAQVKIGIELARKTQRFETRETALDISIDFTAHEEAYRRMLHGDFTRALELAGKPAEGVRLNDATWSGSGGISIESSLSISAFGRNAGIGSLLKQNWEFEISATGELTLGVKASLTAWALSWRSLRSLTVLADTRLLAVVTSANQLLDPKVTDTLSVEASRQWKPTRKDLARWESAIVDLGVLAAPTAMTDEVATTPGAKQPYGEITSSAVLNFTENELRALAARPAAEALLEFVVQLERHYLDAFPTPYNKRDGQLPFLLWPSVREWAREPKITKTLEFRSGSAFAQVRVDQLKAVAFVSRIVNAFERIHGRLQRLHQAPLSGLSFEAALASLRKEQRGLMEDIKDLLTATTLEREDLGFAFFVTLWRLAGPEVDPFAVIQRKSDEQRFVYA